MRLSFADCVASGDQEVGGGCEGGGSVLLSLYVRPFPFHFQLRLNWRNFSDAGHTMQIENKNNSEEDGMDECMYVPLRAFASTTDSP